MTHRRWVGFLLPHWQGDHKKHVRSEGTRVEVELKEGVCRDARYRVSVHCKIYHVQTTLEAGSRAQNRKYTLCMPRFSMSTVEN